MDENDKTMNTPAMRDFLSRIPDCHYFYGNSKNKIEAVNADLAGREFSIVLLASDDQIPVTNGYDAIIVNHMLKNFPNLDGAVHFNDGTRGRDLNTLSILGFNLYKHFGYIYHPDYYSLFCDNEFTDVTKTMGKSVYVPQTIIRHDWIRYTGQDALHYRNEQYYQRDQQVYETRKQYGFPSESVLDRMPK
jgi:hypothetical protein